VGPFKGGRGKGDKDSTNYPRLTESVRGHGEHYSFQPGGGCHEGMEPNRTGTWKRSVVDKKQVAVKGQGGGQNRIGVNKWGKKQWLPRSQNIAPPCAVVNPSFRSGRHLFGGQTTSTRVMLTKICSAVRWKEGKRKQCLLRRNPKRKQWQSLKGVSVSLPVKECFARKKIGRGRRADKVVLKKE